MNQEAARTEQLRSLIAGYSERAAAAYSEAAHAVLPLLSSQAAQRWVEWGCILAQASATAAVKYFRESPEILRAIPDKTDTQIVLETGQELAAEDYGISVEYFRQSPEVLRKIGGQGLREWAGIAADLVRQSDSVGYGTAIEYLKESPKILELLALSHLSAWARVGLVLAQEDLKNKDFLSLEYFRISPELLRMVAFQELRPLLLEITLPLAMTSSKLAMDFLKSVPTILPLLNGLQSQMAVLEIAKSLAAVTPTVVPDFIGHSHKALALADGSLSRFEQWAKKGVEIAQINPERAAAYFSLKLKIAHDTLRQLSTGVFLKDISKTLRLYAEALCGRPVEIRAGMTGQPTTPEGIITLPEKIDLFTKLEDNFRFYKVMTFHEAGHLEFKSYDPVSPLVFQDLDAETQNGLDQALEIQIDPRQATVAPIQALLDRFADPTLARDLWMITEECRIDYLLRSEYQGIRGDMDFVLSQQLKGRPVISELPVRQAILESLLQLSVADTAEVPLGIAEVVSQAYEILKTVKHSAATVNDSLKAIYRLYLLIQRQIQDVKDEGSTERAEPPTQVPPEKISGVSHGILDNLSYRNPLEIQGTHQPGDLKPSLDQPPPPTLQETAAPQQPRNNIRSRETGQPSSTPAGSKTSQEGIYFYDEWDTDAGDYKPRWCCLEEKSLEGHCSDLVDRVKSEYGPMISLLRRHFEHLRPEGFKKVKKQEYGEEIDLESALDSILECKAGFSPSDRVYSLRLKKSRAVATAFLIDMSGSTHQQIGGPFPGAREKGRRVIDVEKEGLLLLCEAVDALGDEFAIYGFSGHSRNQVNFYRIKDFDEDYTGPVQNRIGAIEPGGQNRDGAAIRHVTAKLLGHPAKTKLLILLSDGKPLDEDYQGVYSLEDTRMALREARILGIHPFCITVDRDASEYIRELYSEVSYTIIDNILSLPQRLPRIYKQLTV